MKKLYILLTAMLVSMGGAQLNAQGCNDIFSNFGGGLYFLTDGPDTLFQPNTTNTLYVAGGLITGDLILFQVTAGHTYLWSTEVFNSTFFDSYIRVWSGTDPSFPLLAEDDDGSGFFAGNSTVVWTACEDGFVWVSVNDWPCGNLGTPYNLLTAAIPGNSLDLDAGLDQSILTGFGPANTATTAYLSASATGGDQPYSYSWSGPNVQYEGLTNGKGVAVAPTATTNYSVTVRDASGCVRTDELEVRVEDVTACHPSGRKVNVCHVPPGNPANAHNICINQSAVGAHIGAHGGDYYGSCTNSSASNPAFGPCATLEMDLISDFFANETFWEITNDDGEVVFEGGPGLVDPQGGSISSSPGANYVTLAHFGFALEIEDLRDICADPTDCYTLTMNDLFGDGMCCAAGQGEYILSFFTPPYNGQVYLSSGVFANGEEVQFGGTGCPNSVTSFKTTPEATNAPTDYLRAYPNPFSESATIEFSLSQDEDITLEVYNIHGQRVANLLDQPLAAGVHSVDFNGAELNSGIYLYRLTTKSTVKDGKLILNK